MGKHKTMVQLEAGLDYIKLSPSNNCSLVMIVIRPDINQRQVLKEGFLDIEKGLIGDNWKNKFSSKTNDGSPHPEMQINIMNSRSIQLIAPSNNDWPLAGDQLFIDMNLSDENLPVGSKLLIGGAILEITSIPHNGCKKFSNRFGVDAVKFVNSPIGKKLHLRGINARILKSGQIEVGDYVQKQIINRQK